MGAFFVAYRATGGRLETTDPQRVLDALSSLGGDQGEVLNKGDAALGLHNYRLPSSSKQGYFELESCFIVCDGRIDNRDTLLNNLDQLGLDDSCDDAELIFHYLQTLGAERLDDIIGPFAFVYVDLVQNKLVAARDAMGARSLSFFVHENEYLFSTDEVAFLGVEGFDSCFNEAKVARHLLMTMDDTPISFFAKANLVRPGEVVVLENARLCRKRFYHPRFNPQVYQSSLQSNSRRFRKLFDQAVERRIQTGSRNGVMLSGGLDSVPIAISMTANNRNQETRVIAVSWTFPETPASDETHLSSPLCKDLGIEQLRLNCNAVGVELSPDFPVDPRIPFSMPFVAYQQATLKLLKARDIRIVLTGMHGDLLYCDPKDIVLRMLTQWRIRDAVKEFFILRKLIGSTWSAIKRYLFSAFSWTAKLADYLPSRNPRAAWMLNDQIAKKLVRKRHWLWHESQEFPRPEQYQKLFDGFAGEDNMLARFIEAPYGVERRYPLRDRELCEFVLSVPSEQLYQLSEFRPLIKEAFPELPIAIRDRNDKSNFVEPIVDQIESNQDISTLALEKDTGWGKFVKQCYFEDVRDTKALRRLALWRCAYYNFWAEKMKLQQSASLNSISE